MSQSSDNPLTRPLSSGSPSREQIEEHAALLNEKPTSRDSSPSVTSRTRRRSSAISWREKGLFAWASLATLLVFVLAVLYERSSRKSYDFRFGGTPKGKKNLIFMVSDGMGPTSLSLTRSFRQSSEGLSYNDTLVLDDYVVGQSRTRSTSSLITDSAAGATAFSCGEKSYNGAISVLPDHTPCGTILEAAKQAGYYTGLVVTTRLTDATPACFAAHVNKRSKEDLIARQLLGETPLGRTVDLMLGAGRCRFLPNTTSDSCRDDDRDLVTEAKEDGFTYLSSLKDLDTLEETQDSLPLLGLFAPQDIPYEIDRRHPEENSTYPSLATMSQKALRILSDATADRDQGFFLMIESSRIDHAGHANDPVAQVHEVLAYDTAFKVVLDFLEEEKKTKGTRGLLVATSDHETGGVATAKQLHEYEYPEYLWHPSVLVNASRSVEWLTHDFAAHLRPSASDNGDTDGPESHKDAVMSYLRAALPQHLGIHDASREELGLFTARPRFAAYHFADMISRRAQTGWTTHGHSGADVNIYASNPRSARALRGSVENTDVGVFLRTWLGLGGALMKGVEGRLRSGEMDWMGDVPETGERLDGQSHEVKMDDHYDGVFRSV